MLFFIPVWNSYWNPFYSSGIPCSSLSFLIDLTVLRIPFLPPKTGRSWEPLLSENFRPLWQEWQWSFKLQFGGGGTCSSCLSLGFPLTCHFFLLLHCICDRNMLLIKHFLPELSFVSPQVIPAISTSLTQCPPSPLITICRRDSHCSPSAKVANDTAADLLVVRLASCAQSMSLFMVTHLSIWKMEVLNLR